MEKSELEQLQQRLNLFEAIADNASAVIGAKDLDGRYLYVNQEYSRLFHQEKQSFCGKTDHELFPQDIATAFRQADLEVIEKNKVITVEEKAPVDGKIRDYLSIKFPISDSEGNLFATGLVATDITERKEAEQEILRLSRLDHLTQVANRSRLEQRLEEAIEKAQANKQLIGVAIIDLDEFKPVNDTYGHHIGDSVLRLMAERLVNSCRSSDTVARIGGDEFVVVLEDIKSMEEAISSIQRSIETLNNTYRIESQAINLSASAGIAFYPQHGSEIIPLLKTADTALYRAKKLGRNQLQVA
ncbi:diguanylate cyclase domain-containing protein [Neptuniibacter sp. QD48_55]|uniref:diguanylate cyclase domain-containing protein n=1 Tax=Neptuniibacter sp. QD48_55 TaxID=3398212 RepID=UPI0039F59709